MKDNQTLISASRNGCTIPTYDDGYGPLFILRDSMGIQGIVRARTWESAYEIAEDEFFPDATETVEELRKEYNFTRKHVKIIRADGVERPATDADYPLAKGQFVRWETVETPCEDEDGWMENAFFMEAYGFRPNGGLYQKDLNGDYLDALTDELRRELEVELEIATEE